MKTNIRVETMKLSPEEQWFLRRIIVRLYEKGFGAPAIADMLKESNYA